MKKSVFLIIFFSLFACWPFFKKGYFESHDGEWMVIRFTAFHQTLRDGQFPVRFVDRLNSNYGYPVLNFLYPLPFYLSEIPKLAGFNFVTSIKIVFVLSTVFSSLAMFWALSQKFSTYSSLTGALIYIFIPYRFVDLYVRGSVGEIVALVFVPLILGAVFKIEKRSKKFLPFLSLSVAGLILSHNVIAVLILPLITAIASKAKDIKTYAFIGLGILISAFFAVPAIFELKFVRLSQIKISDPKEHLVNLSNLLIPNWGYGPNPNDTNGLSVQIGVISLAALILSVVIYIKSKQKMTQVPILLIALLLSSFMMHKTSSIIWEKVPFIDVIQFPWRLLAIVITASAFLSAYVVENLPKKILTAGILITAGIIAAAPYIKPFKFVNREEGFYTTNEATTTVRDEYMPLWVKSQKQTRAENKIEISEGKILDPQVKPANYKFLTSSPSESILTINTIYYPGWKGEIDGKPVPITIQQEYGLMELKLPKGDHKVIIKYTGTALQTASEITSLAALFLTGISFFILRRRNS